MEIISQSIPEVLLLAPNVHTDQRGFFLETSRNSFLNTIGIPKLVQQNQSRSQYGVLRGLHYQINNLQGKLVRCSRGSVFDVAVDIRRGSPTFGKYASAILDDKLHHQLWIPEGFAHGFLVLSEVADFCYSCSNYYYPNDEYGILWNDESIGIKWPELNKNKKIQLSKKDLTNPSLESQKDILLPSFN